MYFVFSLHLHDTKSLPYTINSFLFLLEPIVLLAKKKNVWNLLNILLKKVSRKRFSKVTGEYAGLVKCISQPTHQNM